MMPQMPIRNPFFDDAGFITVPWIRFFETLTRQNVLITPAPPVAVVGALLLKDPDSYGIATTITPPTPLGDVVVFEVQAQFWDAPTGGTAVSDWITLGSVDALSPVLTSGYWSLPAATQYCLMRARSANYQEDVSAWVLASSRFAVTSGTAGDVTGIAATYEYADDKQIRVRLTFTPPSPLGVWEGVHIWEEEIDQSSSQGAPMNGTVPLDGSRNLGGAWAPIDRGVFGASPVVLLLPRPAATVTKRFYLQSRSATTENALVRANQAGPTPSVTLVVTANAYQSGEEFARLVTGAGVAVEYDDTQVSSAKYSIVFTWTAPTNPPAAWQLEFGGVQIVYEYDNGRLANGPTLAVNDTTARSDWYELFVGTSLIKCWFVSMDASEEPRLNTIVENLTPSAVATVTWPLVSRPPDGKYADNVTSFSVTNPRYFINGQGLKQLLIDVTWVKPVGDDAQARWGGVVVWLHTPDGNKYQMSGAETGSQLTIQLAVFPTSSQSWVFYGVSQDNNANANTDGRSPMAGTPTSTLAVTPPPLGAAGSEYTLNVFGTSFAAATVAASDGTTLQRITATFSPPLDSTWGGVELRVYDGATLLASTKATPSPIAVTIPNPATSTTVTAWLVSYDVNGRINTEVGTTPQGNLLIGSVAGTLDLRRFLPASTDNFTINGSFLQVKTGVAITVDASGNLRVSPSGIDASLIASGAVGNAALVNGAVDDLKLASAAVTAAKIAAGAVGNAALVNGAVDDLKLATAAVTAAKIAANAVTSPAIAASAITAGKIAALSIVAGDIATDAITASKILAGSITTVKINAGAVTATEIAAGAIVAGKIAALSIVAGDIATDAITASKILAGSITTVKINAGAVTATEIAAGAIVAGKIAALSIVAGDIATDAIIASKILAGSITTVKINAGAISSDKLDATAINVGGGGSKPGKFSVFNSVGSQVGFIGTEGTGLDGAWFQTLSVGGSSYGTGVIKANSSGQITIDYAAANNSNNKILLSQTTYDAAYTTAGMRIQNGVSPAAGSDTTWFISRGMVVYGSGNYQSNYYAVSVNRDPTSSGAGEVVVYGATASSYIRLSGSDGRCRADGGYQVGGSVGVTGSILPVTGINTTLVSAVTGISTTTQQIQYLDWSGNPATSPSFVTVVTPSTSTVFSFSSLVTTSIAYTKGIRTT